MAVRTNSPRSAFDPVRNQIAERGASYEGSAELRDPIPGQTVRILGGDQERRVVIKSRPDGRHFFVEERFWEPSDYDTEAGLELGWMPESFSGLYETANDAEAAAYQEYGFLQSEGK
jgi:hypothetical protein